MRLHHRVGVVGRGVGVVDLHGGLRERAFEVADAIRLRWLAGFVCGVFFRRQIECPPRTLVLHANQAAGGARLLQRVGHHQRNGLVIVFNVGAAQQGGGVHLALAELARVLRGDHGQHAGRAPRGLDVHAADAALGNGGTQHVAHGGVWRRVVVFIRVMRRAGRFQRAVNAVNAMAHDLQLIDGILGSGSIEFHRVRPSLAPALHSGFAPPRSA